MHGVKTFLGQAEDVLDVAAAADGDAGNLAILVDRQGGLRMVDPMGWSLPALCAEFGARAVYTVERRGYSVRVEGWGGGERCLIQRHLYPRRTPDFPAGAASRHPASHCPMMLQLRSPDREHRENWEAAYRGAAAWTG